MKLHIPKEYFTGDPIPPRVFLCTTGKSIIGELPATSRSLNAKWGTSYSELSFEIPRTYVDILDGTTKVHPLYDKVEVPRNVLLKDYSYFSLQDINKTSSDNDIKSVTCFDYAYSTLGNKYVNDFRVNTGNIDSIEVMYNEKKHGYDYVIDQDKMYVAATAGKYDAYENYYIKEYVDKSFVWEQVQVADAAAYATYFGDGVNSKTPLHIRDYPNVRFCWDTNQELSLVHLILEYAPEWRVGHVDTSLWRKERKLDIDRSDIYSLLTNDIADIFKCVVIFDSLEGTVNFYEEENEGLTEDGSIVDTWNSDVFISRDNLANSIEVQYSGDDIRTKLKLSSSDGVNVREVNLGSDYIMNLDYYHNDEWMEQDLFEAYSDYLEAVKTYAAPYEEEMKKWVAANNKYTEVMNAVPAENDVVMIDDVFEKLYCMFGAINTAFATPDMMDDIDEASRLESVPTLTTLYYDEACTEIVDKTKLSNGDVFVVGGYKFTYNGTNFVPTDDLAETTLMSALLKKLQIYRIDEDAKGTVQDNILLTLKNTESATATIRIYAPKKAVNTATTPRNPDERYYVQSGTTAETYEYKYIPITSDDIYKNYPTLYINDYTISCIVVDKNGITTKPFTGTMKEWIRGRLTAHKMGLVSTEESGATTPNFTVKYIGTMGAYLVSSKNEYVYINDEWIPSEDYLRTYGVNLLKEKVNTYLKIFQTQTEGMYQDDGYQCIAQDSEPHNGNVSEGTRWFKTNAQPPTLYKRNSKASTVWAERWDEFVEEENEANLLNYQRYMDNYQKLTVASKVLQEQEKKAGYLLDGYSVPTNTININNLGDSSLTEEMHRAALTHFCGVQAYASVKITNASTYNSLDILYSNVYENGSTKQYLNPIDKTKLANGARYVVQDYAYQYNATTNKFERRYNSIYLTPMDLEEYEIEDSNGNMTALYPILPFTTVEDPAVYAEANGDFDPTATYYADVEISDGVTARREVSLTEDEYNERVEDGEILYVLTSGNLYAVYLKGNTPYVAYYSSQGIHQMKKDYYAELASMERFFNEDQWIRLSPFIREDEYTNDNIISTEYDSEEEKNKIFKEFVEEAAKELKTLSQPSLKFSMTMANILALPEFVSLVDQFQLGKFIRVGINDDYTKRARLLEVTLNFDDLSDFSCVFGDLKTSRDQVNLHAELLAQAVQAGSTVAKGEASWQSAVDKSNSLEESIANGLRDAALSVASSSGQNITWDQRGIVGRKLIDGTSDQYEPEQFMLTNNKLVFTSDGFQTAKSAFGKFYIEDENGNKVEKWGLLSDAVVSGYIQGSTIKGGSLQIGDPKKEDGNLFIVHEDGSVEIRSNGAEKYAAKSALTVIDNAYRFSIILDYEGLTVFSDTSHTCIITCDVYDYKEKITDKIIENETVAGNDLFNKTFIWERISNDSKSDSEWKPTYVENKPNQIKISVDDVAKNAQFKCQVDFDETKFPNETTENN